MTNKKEINTSKPVEIRQKRGGKIYVRPKKLTSLVMLSCGVDSIYVLNKLLTETDDTVLVHHVHLINDEGRYEIEAERTRKIVQWFKTNRREFRYTESIINHKGFNGFGFDVMSVMFEAGMVSRSHNMAKGYPIDRILTGWCLGEDVMPGRIKHVRACVAAICFPLDPPKTFWFETVTKAEEIKSLPPEVVEMSWTCRKPKKSNNGTDVECGECRSCELMRDARASLESDNISHNTAIQS